MLRRLFKGRHPLRHPDPAVRRSALQKLDDTEAEALADEVVRLLREDPDPGVRLACLVRVRDRAVLESVQNDPVLAEAAAQRLRALSAGPGHAGGADETLTPARLAALPTAETAARLEQVTDPDALVELALQTRGELRQHVLDHGLLRLASTLTRLERRSRGKDKSLNRHARTRLDRYRRLLHEADAHRARAEELAAALGRTPPSRADQAWRERQHQLHDRLEQALDEYRVLAGELAEFGEPAQDLEHLRSEPGELPPLEQAAADPAPAADGGDSPEDTVAGDDPFEGLVEGFRGLDAALTAGRPFADLAAERQALTDRWLTAADHRPPSPEQHQVFEQVSHRFRELADAMERLADRLDRANLPALPEQPLTIGPPDDAAAHRALWDGVAERRRLLKRLEQVDRQVRWPDWAPPTAEYANVVASLARLREELGRADEVLADEVARLEAQIAELAAAIDEGSLNQAQSLLARSRALHDALPASATRALGKALGKQSARLAELKDWQTFATSPKREALVEAMAELAAEPLEARAQADRIKALRNAWRELGPITQAADGRLADRFNAEAEKAFEPCRAYFAAQAEQRKANLGERRRICDQLEQYLAETDWAHADMRAAERIMRAARDEWRRFHPVDRNPGKSVEARFEELQERLHDLVKAEWDRNLKAKEAIVAEAAHLADAELPVQDKVATAKRLQHQWREVGITPRRPDQRLWQSFREACDRIFSARDESRQAADAAVQAAEARLSERLDQFAGVLEQRDAATASAAELSSFRQETADVDRLPQSRRRALVERRSELLDRYSALLAQQRRARGLEAILALCRWDEDMTAAEAAGGAGADSPAPEPPAGAEALLAARLAAVGEPVPVEAARRLVVRAELVAGKESPPEDEPLRLEVQVERLQAGLSGAGGSAETPQALVEAWCRLGPKDGSLAPLRERLVAAVRTLS